MTLLQHMKMGMALSCLFLITGCANTEAPAPTSRDAAFAVSGIAVLPVRPAVEFDENQTIAEDKLLQDGSQIMNGLMKEALADKSGIRFVTATGKAGKKEAAVNNLDAARRVASQQGCNTVLETTLSRYHERVGGDYGVKQPAAVTFAYKLYEVGEGRVLCHGRFDEQQQSVMENLLTLPKAQSRGLVWLTAEELARDGIKEKFDQCPYLGGK